MAEDLGAWPPEQATVLLEVLKQAGLSPQAKRTREGILVTVPDAEAEEAQRQLVANMDTIAHAARPEPRAPKRTAKRAAPGTYGRRVSDPNRPALTSQRMTRIAGPLSLLLVFLLISAVVPLPNLLLVPLAVGVVIYLVGKRVQREGGGDGRLR